MHRVNPIVKTIWLVGTFLLVVASKNLTLMIIIFVVTLVVAIIARIALKMYLLLFGLGALMMILSVIVWALNLRQGPVVYVVPYLNWVFTAGGIRYGLAAGLRLATMILAGFVFLIVTPSTEWVAILVKLRIPYSIAFAFNLGFRFFPTFLGEMSSIRQAQMARGFDLEKIPFYKRAWYSVPIIFPFISSALRMVVSVASALEARGFGSPAKRTYYRDVGLRKRDYPLAVLIIALIALGMIYGKQFP